MLSRAALLRTYRELGMRMFYLNYSKRVGVIAVSVGVLNLMAILD